MKPRRLRHELTDPFPKDDYLIAEGPLPPELTKHERHLHGYNQTRGIPSVMLSKYLEGYYLSFLNVYDGWVTYVCFNVREDAKKPYQRSCFECGSSSGVHSKACSKWKRRKACAECGNSSGRHFRPCSKYTKPKRRNRQRNQMTVDRSKRWDEMSLHEREACIREHEEGVKNQFPGYTLTSDPCPHGLHARNHPCNLCERDALRQDLNQLLKIVKEQVGSAGDLARAIEAKRK